MLIRCHHLGLIAGLALALSLSASEWTSPGPAHTPVAVEQAAFHSAEAPVSPVPAPVLLLAGGLLAVAAMVRWRQHLRR